MPTDIALALLRKAEQDERDHLVMADLEIVFLWSTLGLMSSALMFDLGFGPALAKVLVAVG
jgi:hypothetical protein